MPFEEREKLNYDHPDAFESERMAEDVRRLIKGYDIEMPTYDYCMHTRSDRTVIVEPRQVIILEGILVLENREHASIVDNYMYHYTEIGQIDIYCDNPDIYTYKQYQGVDEVAETDWYQRAVSQNSVFWKEMKNVDEHGNQYWSLCLVRQIPRVNSDYNAVLVIRISDNYLKTRISSQEYRNSASVDNTHSAS